MKKNASTPTSSRSFRSANLNLVKPLVLALTLVLTVAALFNWQYSLLGMRILATNGALNSQSAFTELSQTLTPKVIDKLSTVGANGTRTYKIMSELLESARNLSNVTYIYVAVRDEASGAWRYILDGHKDGTDVGIDHLEVVEADYVPYYDQAATSGMMLQGVEEASRYGRLTTNYYPLKDITGRVYGVMGFDYDIKSQATLLDGAMTRAYALGVLSIFSLTGYLLLRRRQRTA